MKKNKQIGLGVLLSVISAICYRAGGSGNYPRWCRPVGVGFCVVLMCAVIEWHWSAIMAGGLSAGLSTTYFKKKGKDARWWNWLIVGFALSMALLPYAYFTGQMTEFLVRTGILTLGIFAWSEINGNAVWEETGRGALTILTMLIFLIGG